MVTSNPTVDPECLLLSVLALSSRFDGPGIGAINNPPFLAFSTRSVESF